MASEARREANRKHYRANKDAYYKKRDKRVSDIERATPSWHKREKAKLKRLYKIASMRQKKTGEKYNLDHWCPLNHPRVCGLHCVANLVIILAEENLKKGADFDIDSDENMQDLSHLQG